MLCPGGQITCWDKTLDFISGIKSGVFQLVLSYLLPCCRGVIKNITKQINIKKTKTPQTKTKQQKEKKWVTVIWKTSCSTWFSGQAHHAVLWMHVVCMYACMFICMFLLAFLSVYHLSIYLSSICLSINHLSIYH